MKKKIKKQNGITLIALIITIIVMLILVAVTINMAINGGLFSYAGKAVGETQNAIDDEKQIGTGGIEIDGTWYESINEFLESNEEISWEQIIADAIKNPDKYKHASQTTTNGDIGIGADGNPINMDKWKYVETNGEMMLRGIMGSGYTPAYSYEYNSNNNVITDIVCPRYIKPTNEDDFYLVTSIGQYAFRGLSELTSIMLPNSITYIDTYAFMYCTNLKDVYYTGTMEQWEQIANHDSILTSATIHCTDGDITPTT